MTTRELIELASLDALGLLDPGERERFERALEAASPAVQRQIRREQDRLAGDMSTLPEVEPPSHLRDGVLARVREAIEAARGGVAGRLVPRDFSIRAHVSPLWRAACIGFATATIVLLSLGFNMQREVRDAMAAYTSGEIAELASQLGPRFEQVLLSPTANRVSLVPAAGTTDAAHTTPRAVVYLDEETKTAFLVCKDLPVGEGGSKYKLVIMNDNGEPGSTVATFNYQGGLAGQAIPVDVRMDGGFGIVETTTNRALMQSI